MKLGRNPRKWSSGIWLIVGVLISALFKFGQVGTKMFAGAVHGIANIGKFDIGGGEKSGVFYGGVATSPALLGVGWIIGPKIAAFVFVGVCSAGSSLFPSLP